MMQYSGILRRREIQQKHMNVNHAHAHTSHCIVTYRQYIKVIETYAT